MAMTMGGDYLYFGDTSTGGVVYSGGSTATTFCRARVVFNGRDGSVINGGVGYNISSVSRVTTGKYTITYVTSMPSSTYAVLATNKIDTGDYDGNSWVTGIYRIPSNPNASSVTVGSYYAGSGSVDGDQMHVAVYCN